MRSAVHPLLTFLDHTEDVLAFYAGVFGGEVDLLRYRDVGLADTADAERIIRGTLTTPHGLHLVAGDVPAGMPYEYGRNISLILDGAEPEVRAWFDALSVGGTVTVPLTDVAWGRVFGHVLDRHGVGWIIDMARDEDGTLHPISDELAADTNAANAPEPASDPTLGDPGLPGTGCSEQGAVGPS